jgi:hypothetical protein
LSKDEGRSIAAFFESPVTVDDVAAAWMKVIAKKALPSDLVDDPIFRGAIEHRAHGKTELEDNRGRRSPAAQTQGDVLYCDFPPPHPLWWDLHSRCGVRAPICARILNSMYLYS